MCYVNRRDIIWPPGTDIEQYLKAYNYWRNRQTLWGGCMAFTPKLLLNDT